MPAIAAHADPRIRSKKEGACSELRCLARGPVEGGTNHEHAPARLRLQGIKR
jgi:hypothetical protein